MTYAQRQEGQELATKAAAALRSPNEDAYGNAMREVHEHIGRASVDLLRSMANAAAEDDRDGDAIRYRAKANQLEADPGRTYLHLTTCVQEAVGDAVMAIAAVMLDRDMLVGVLRDLVGVVDPGGEPEIEEFFRGPVAAARAMLELVASREVPA